MVYGIVDMESEGGLDLDLDLCPDACVDRWIEDGPKELVLVMYLQYKMRVVPLLIRMKERKWSRKRDEEI